MNSAKAAGSRVAQASRQVGQDRQGAAIVRAKVFVLLLATLLLASLWGTGCSAEDDDDQTLWVFAASSLTDAFGEIQSAFSEANPEISVRMQFAGSTQLATQISQGAPADIFASANEQVLQLLEGSSDSPNGETLATPVIFARNELVIAVPKDNPLGISDLADLGKADPARDNSTRDNLLLAICHESVPCGMLAQEAAETNGIVLRPNTEEANVRAVLTKLLIGEVDAGLIYRSDAMSATSKVTAIPITPTPTANYPIVTLSNNPAAQKFIEFVLSPAAQKILTNHGFTPATS